MGAIMRSMAKQTTVTITDDLDGSANAKEVSFSLDGRTWAIDLSALHCESNRTRPREESWQGGSFVVSFTVTQGRCRGA
jgi:hypothetical protein